MGQAAGLLGLNDGETNTFNDFFRCINLCHDCISLKSDSKGKEEELVYNGPSVDEVCLLDMSRDTGISHFITRDSDNIKIVLNGVEESYAIIKMFPFTSERKAMSMVLQHPTENKALCYVKGADSSVFPMCNNWTGPNKVESVFGIDRDDPGNSKIMDVEKSVENMARKGLRTLLYGVKEIEWDGTRDPLDLPVEEIECGLTLLAATGVEDLLQENVKECIEDFRAAGISVWMLTGDKGLTAKEIGVSCGLIPPEGGSDETHQPTVQGNLATEQNMDAPSAGQKVMMFADDDTEVYGLHAKIKEFCAEVANEKSYQVLISGMVIAVALDNELTHPELG